MQDDEASWQVGPSTRVSEILDRYGDIAEVMGCPVDTVKTRMFHARRHLRRILAGELADWI